MCSLVTEKYIFKKNFTDTYQKHKYPIKAMGGQFHMIIKTSAYI